MLRYHNIEQTASCIWRIKQFLSIRGRGTCEAVARGDAEIEGRS